MFFCDQQSRSYKGGGGLKRAAKVRTYVCAHTCSQYICTHRVAFRGAGKGDLPP